MHMMSGPTYQYVANTPLDLEMTELAAGALLGAVSYHSLAHRHELLRFLCVLDRVYPYLGEEECESVKPLREIWALKKIEFEEKEQVESKKEFDVSVRPIERGRWDALHKHQRTRDRMIWGDLPAHGRPKLLGGELYEEDEKLEKLLGISEERLPWAAWALHESPQKRVVAAARYIGTFRYSRDKAIKDEVLLLDARKTAMELLVEGGTINEEVAVLFLEAYEGRKKEEEQEGKGLGRGKGKEAESASVGFAEAGTRAMGAALEARGDELDDCANELSDPEGFDDGQDESDEDAADETESDSGGESEAEDVRGGSGDRRK